MERNDKHDATSYENCSYTREIYDGNLLYESYKKSKQGSDWKYRVQEFEKTFLLQLGEIQNELKTGDFKFLPNSHFIQNERGKVRPIVGEQIHDRIGKHALCDEILTPSVRKSLIYDNGASLEGKGIDFTRRRIKTHLHRYFYHNKTNEGYVLLIDFSKYYDNIRHDILKELLNKHAADPIANDYMNKVIDHSKVDVSYLSNEEYENCLNELFNSVDYFQIDKNLKTGTRFMAKHMNIGDQLSQVAGVLYPSRIDNYIKIVRGMKYYGRYMDDSYLIYHDKKVLEDILKNVLQIADELGITVNLKKTRIVKLSSQWRFLQNQYTLTKTGKVIVKINKTRLVKMRRKLKKLAGRLTEKEFNDLYKSWFNSYYKLMSKLQRKNLNKLYEQLKHDCYS